MQNEARHVTISEVIGLDFHSFIPKSDLSSQVHFFSHIRPDSTASKAGLKDGDRILQINGVNVANLEHEDVRKLMQLVTPMVLTVVYDPKYLLILEQPVENVEEKPPSNERTFYFSTPKMSSFQLCLSRLLVVNRFRQNFRFGKRLHFRKTKNYRRTKV